MTQPSGKPKGLVDLVQEGAGQAFAGLGQGFERAGAALATPEVADLAPLVAAADLPELGLGGGLGALSTRLDREADLFRNVAMRELARVAWVQRVTQAVVVAGAVAEVLVAAAAVVLATFGAAEGRSSLLLVAAGVIGVAGAGVVTSAARTRTFHAKLAEDALAHARAIEERMFRVGLAMEWREAGPALYQEALIRLERDVAPPPAPRAHDG